ncbi:hypothetical protein Tco_1353132 [Tanacetum coccineum]
MIKAAVIALETKAVKAQDKREFATISSEDGDEPRNDATCLMEIDSQEVQTKTSISNNDLDVMDLQKENEELLRINDLEFEVKKLVNDKEMVEHCKKCDIPTQEVDSLKCNVSKLQNEALNFSKFKKSGVVLDDMLSRPIRKVLDFLKMRKPLSYV